MFEAVIEAMTDAVLVVDARGSVVAVNSAALRLTGYARAQLVGMAYGRLLLDESSGVRSGARRAADGDEAPIAQQSWVITAGGERVPVSVTGSPVVGERGDLEQIVIVARDVRELRQLIAEKDAELARRRAAEAELRAINERSEEHLDEIRTTLLLAERRATLGTLAGGVGHELRNIATVQVSAVHELRDALTTPDRLAARVADILPDLQRATDHITAHAKRLLQLAQPGPDSVEAVNLWEVIESVLAMLRGAGKLRYVTPQVEIPREPKLRVTASRMRIEQLFVNLVGNAIDSIGKTPGSVVIKAAPSEDGKRVVCEVCDTGPGISVEDREKIFQPFFTTKPPEYGTGLGLPVAREIVESYGGKLELVDPPEGGGARFRFDLWRSP